MPRETASHRRQCTMETNARTKAPRVPQLRCKTVSGYQYAVVGIHGRDHYLGQYGSPGSIAQYNAIIARWLAGGRSLEQPAGAALSVNELLLKFVEHAERKYAGRRRAAKIVHGIGVAIRAVRDLFGLTDAAAFGPKALGLVREHWIKSGLARKTINQNTIIIKSAWRWAAAEELVPGTCWHALNALAGLRRGDAPCPEPKKVRPVPDAHVDAIKTQVSRQVWALVELQRLTGMRSSEAASMRTIDIDTSGALWTYRPREHKTEHHDIDRVIYLGARAQTLLRPWLRSDLTAYLFQPKDAMAELRKRRSAERQTPASCGNRPGTNRKRKPRRQPGERYTPQAYRNAIVVACRKAAVPQWFPHQLRHSFATAIRREFGIEAARVMLGHQHIGITEVYAERDRAVALEVVAKLG